MLFQEESGSRSSERQRPVKDGYRSPPSVSGLFQYAQFFADLDEGCNALVELLAGVAC